MTNEEASLILELMAIDMTGAMASLPRSNPMVDVLSQRIEAINRAQDALRQWDEHLKSLWQ